MYENISFCETVGNSYSPEKFRYILLPFWGSSQIHQLSKCATHSCPQVNNSWCDSYFMVGVRLLLTIDSLTFFVILQKYLFRITTCHHWVEIKIVVCWHNMNCDMSMMRWRGLVCRFFCLSKGAQNLFHCIKHAEILILLCSGSGGNLVLTVDGFSV